MYNAGYPKGKLYNPLILFEVMNNLAVIHAYLCADGYVIKNSEKSFYKYYMIGFRNTNLILLEDFQKKFQSAFDIKVHLEPGERCRLGSKKIYTFLVNTYGSFYSHHWELPQLEENELRKWLRAYFDCDGWVFCRSRQNRHIGLDSVNEKGIYQIKQALASLGIVSSVRKRSTRPIFSLIIYGKQNLFLFSQLIGFLHPEKKEKLQLVLDDFVSYLWQFPVKEKALKVYVKNILLEKAKIKPSQGIVRLCSSREENISRLQKELKTLYGLHSLYSKRINGLGTIYYELCVNKKSDVYCLVKNNLLSELEKEKWLKL